MPKENTNPFVSASDSVPTYASTHPPALTVDPGETFVMRTNDRFAALADGGPRDPEQIGAVVGPVFVRGVSPDDRVSVEVVNIRPLTAYAYVLASSSYGILGDRVAARVQRVRVEGSSITLASGASTAYRPMIGKLGLAPPGGPLPTHDCGDFGGALSNTQIRPGARTVLRAHHPGGLLFLEDVHAGMGDGEATASAFEMAAEVTLKCTIETDSSLEPPMILTEDRALTLGIGESLDQAAEVATQKMLALIQQRSDADLTDAAMLVGAAVDLRVAFMGAQPKKVYAAIDRGLIGL